VWSSTTRNFSEGWPFKKMRSVVSPIALAKGDFLV
jgi:hypothetical protein